MNTTEQITADQFKKRIVSQSFPSKVTANGTTNAIVRYLNGNGHRVRRTSNHATFDIRRAAGVVMRMINGRGHYCIGDVIRQLRSCYNKGTSEIGWPDIEGLTKQGVFVGVEVKIRKDTMSEAQKVIRSEVLKRGGLYIIAKSFDDFKEKFESIDK